MKTFDGVNPSTKGCLLIVSEIFLLLWQLHQVSIQLSSPLANIGAYFSLSGHHAALHPLQINGKLICKFPQYSNSLIDRMLYKLLIQQTVQHIPELCALLGRILSLLLCIKIPSLHSTFRTR